MTYTILFRKGINAEHEEEFKVAQRYFNVVERRTQCPGGTIIGRFSTLPFYAELQADLICQGSDGLINSVDQHHWIANMDWAWDEDLKDYTPATWTDQNFHTALLLGRYVVKGRTNSRKFNWNELMFAHSKREALYIAGKLASDPLIGPQGIVYREYVPLVPLEEGANEMPMSNEWRFFYLSDKLLCHAPYWTTVTDQSKFRMDNAGLALAQDIANIIAEKALANFFVLDIAEKKSGGWVLIEINDGQQSGLSMNDPDVLYRELKRALSND